MIRKLIQALLLISGTSTLAQTWQWAPDRDIGSSLPALEMLDANGERVTLAELSGKDGLIIFFTRSTVW
ncbi:MAG: hypothetical protein VW831_10295 [Gammaproteobacteria bacterium]